MLAAIALFAVSACASATDEAGSSDETPTSAEQLPLAVPDPPAATVADVLALTRPVVLAHGAGEDDYPPNTLYSFVNSARDGVDVLDLDVWHSADDEVMVIHDSTVDRTTSGTGDVTSMTATELGELDAAHWFSAECTCPDQPDDAYTLRGIRSGDRPPPEGFVPEDFGVPTLDQVIERFDGWVLNIEIKGDGETALRTADLTIDLLRRTGTLDAAIVTSFKDDVVAHLAEIGPEVELTPGLDASARFVLADEAPPAGQRILQLPVAYEGIDLLTDEFLARAHAANLLVWVWPNDEEYENEDAYRTFFDRGLDGVNANRPKAAVSARDAFVGSQ